MGANVAAEVAEDQFVEITVVITHFTFYHTFLMPLHTILCMTPIPHLPITLHTLPSHIPPLSLTLEQSINHRSNAGL